MWSPCAEAALIFPVPWPQDSWILWHLLCLWVEVGWEENVLWVAQ